MDRAKFYDDRRYTLKVAAWGILQHFDLVDLLPCLAGRPCTFVKLRNAKGELQSGEALLTLAADLNYLPHPWQPQFV